MSKLPFTLSLQLVFRLLLPGLIVALALLPVLQSVMEALRVTLDVESALLVSVLVWGWVVILLDMPIYMAFEGRRFWPAPLWRWMQGRETRRREKLEREAKKAVRHGSAQVPRGLG